MIDLHELLLLNAVLLALLLGAQPIFRVQSSGLKYALGSLDKPEKLGRFTGRLQRLKNNQAETMLLITPVCLIGIILGSQNAFVALLATIHIVARFVYSFVTLMGIPVLRSVSWLFSFAANICLLFVFM